MVAIKLELQLFTLLIPKLRQDNINLHCSNKLHFILLFEARRNLCAKMLLAYAKNGYKLQMYKDTIVNLRLENSEAAIFNEVITHINIINEPYYAGLVNTWINKYQKHLDTWDKV